MSHAPELLVHLCAEADWESARAAPEWRPESFGEVGFVHLSAQCQVHLPANRLFAGRNDLVVLYLNPARLGAVVRWEPGVPTDPESMLFPHLYGPLPIASVVDVRPYIPGPDGQFAPLIHRLPQGNPKLQSSRCPRC
jgi:uncharacterized protein (DUF952 family)